MLLLMAGGMVSEVWAKEITYHILTMPFTVGNYNNTGDYKANIRVEALQCTSKASTVGLPAEFKSPLATGYRYWKTATSTYTYLYDYEHNNNIVNTKYYIYQCEAGNAYACLTDEITDLENTSSDADRIPSDIYVTYEYNSSNGILDLTGVANYNVAITSKGVQKFMCYNRSRNNRIANANATGVSGDDLASDDFVTPVNDKKQLGWNWSKWGPIGIFLGFKFTGSDPYNITIMTSYAGSELHITDAITNVDNTGTIKPYAGSTLMAKVGATYLWFDVSNDRHYKLKSGIKDAGQWTEKKYADCKELYTNTPDEAKYDTWVGFYRHESPTMNTFALLPQGDDGYVFVGSKMNQGTGNTPTINQPKNGQYYTYYDHLDNDGGGRSQPYFKLQALSSAHPINFYQIRSYTLKVKTHGSSTVLSKEIKWSDAMASERIVDHIPDALKRKYVQFKGAYKEETLTNAITTFADAKAAGISEIWLKYETDTEALPFEVLPAGGRYADARWYTMRVNGKAEQKNIAYNSENNFITGSSSIGFESDLHHGENSANAMVAFVGDPYELKIISRAASEAAGDNRYIGCATEAADGTTLNTNKTGSSDISTWEIVYESSDAGNFVLRQFNTVNAPKYIGWSTTGNKPVIYSSEPTRIRVVELDKVSYTYHIMRLDGTIAIKATVTQDVGKALKSWLDIPTVIRSPFLSTATVNYYATSAHATSNDPANKITNAPYDYSTNHDIYVRYSYVTPPTGDTYNVSLNGEYIYTNTTEPEPVTDDNIYSKATITGDEAGQNAFAWVLDYSDPYAMKIRNKGKDRYIRISSAPADDTALGWDVEANASLFVVKQSGNNSKVYEVMAATGDTYDAGDAEGISTTYFNIGRNVSSTTANTVKLFANTHYNSGYSVLQFSLAATNANEVTYHLIDMAGKELLRVNTRQTSTDAPSFPPTYRSPLVENYYYYKEDQFDQEGEGSNTVYTLKSEQTQLASVGPNSNIYVTYDVNNLVDLKAGQLYLLKYEGGQMFNEEDGSDGISETAHKAIYPYCNGDCNFFVYGQEQYDLQQEGAASTRTRWAWYVQSDLGSEGDPYHVKIMSRQTETYPATNGSERNAYFSTYQPDGYSEVVTGLVWPGISGLSATEYMVLGNVGQYQLVTTNEISGSRYTVNSFEQYWKTFDTIRKKVYGDSKANDTSSGPATIPLDTKTKYNGVTERLLRDSLQTDLGWHCYEKWAYAKRWNGYNDGYGNNGVPKASKGWEKIEHWFQTVNMGEGYFDFVETSIDPVLILLDQHGWEIMRKPLPSSSTDPQKDAKYEAIRPYNSPMVKEYAFWATAKKRSGLHQYYLLSDRIGGDDYTSADLTNLPPYGSKNVLDKKGNLNDQYVTYIVKDEYAQTYTPSTKEGKEFLIEQGSKYASTSDGTSITKNDVSSVGNMQKHITDGGVTEAEMWYVKPNWNIDCEMGYGDVGHSWTGANQKNPNAYDYWRYKDNPVAAYISTKTIADSLGYFSFSNGFDPYNIQITPRNYNTKFIKTNATRAYLGDGVMHSEYASPPASVSLGDSIKVSEKYETKWFDGRNLAVTNVTFMAVQDEEGNMQLMPRFDHSTRMSEFGTLIAPTDAAAVTTYTKLYRPEVYDYYIIDKTGKESLRYKSGGDLLPRIPEHFKSPLATNFTYYATATYDSKTGTYSDYEDKIEESLDGATLTGNKVYVRYEYNEEADGQKILKGNWLTMQLNEKDAIYDDGIRQASGDKPATIDEDDRQWQWKFLESPQSTPDPYAVCLFNRSQSAGTKAIEKRFALLSHSGGDYALAEAGLGTYTYKFLNGDGGMSTSQTAMTDTELGFTCSTGTFSGTNSQIKLTNDVEHAFTYKVYTNSGAFAVSDTQTQEEVNHNDWMPRIPDDAKTPLLNLNQFRYYSKDNVTFGTGEPIPSTDIASADTTGKSLSYLYGLYDDEVVVRYTPYDPSVTEYMVPNVRNATGGTVAKGVGSNDVALDLSQTLLYNVIWHNDNMMATTDKTDVAGHANQAITTDKKHEWLIGGEDPYAMTLYNRDAEKYITAASADNNAACTLTDGATTFMLLPKSGYDNGMLAITGNKESKLTIPDDGRPGTYDAAKITTGDPAEFMIFALATHKVIYHLMIKNIGEDIIVPYKDAEKTGGVPQNYKIGTGSTLRDLKSKDTTGGEAGHSEGDLYQLGETLKAIGSREGTTSGLFARDSIYCYDAGHVSLGDELEVPSAFYRPNVHYSFIIEGVYNSTGTDSVTTMDAIYKGVKTTNMGREEGLLLNTVFVNIVYSFDEDLGTNSGNDFVTAVTQNKWYTVETSDATPKLAQFTNAWGMKLLDGRESHYTNDYLWTPVGDPYGFKFYNRYIYKTDAATGKVLTTATIANDAGFMMDIPANNDNRDIYELLSGTTPGYFKIHPMINKSGLAYYLYNDGGTVKLSTSATDFTFGLSEEVLKPYYDRAGYVGGLTAEGKTAYDNAADLMAKQAVVYNDENVVAYTPGYYRLHSPISATSIKEERYASGYTHAIERDQNGDGNEDDAIPLHFYERKSAGARKYKVDLKDGFTISNATRGDLPVPQVENDPASIFYFPGNTPNATGHPLTTMSTQGLNVLQNKMTTGAGTTFCIMDIGGAVFLIHDNAVPESRMYFNYDQSTDKYDMKFSHYIPTDDARWCLQPVQKGATAGLGEMALTLKGNKTSDGHSYATFCAPFDVLLTDAENDTAWVAQEWNTTIMRPKKIGEVNTEANGCPVEYRGSSQFVPAGTPVIIRTTSAKGEVTLALPTTTPTTGLTTAISCVFSGRYLEQMLAHGSDYVYTFGLPSQGSFTEDASFASNGELAAAGNVPGTGVGFYKNANPNKEKSEFANSWDLNNKYVYGNKIFYRAGSSGSSAPAMTRGVEFVPVIFDVCGDEQNGEENGLQQVKGDNRIYDLQGRCVANEQQVQDGSWRTLLAPGIYIINGMKFKK